MQIFIEENQLVNFQVTAILLSLFDYFYQYEKVSNEVVPCYMKTGIFIFGETLYVLCSQTSWKFVLPLSIAY